MINTPVHVSTELDDDDNQIYTTEIFDADGDFICESAHIDLTDEILKRINLHDELVASLSEVNEFVKWYYNKNGQRPPKALHEIATEIDSLLEKCK